MGKLTKKNYVTNYQRVCSICMIYGEKKMEITEITMDYCGKDGI